MQSCCGPNFFLALRGVIEYYSPVASANKTFVTSSRCNSMVKHTYSGMRDNGGRKECRLGCGQDERRDSTRAILYLPTFQSRTSTEIFHEFGYNWFEFLSPASDNNTKSRVITARDTGRVLAPSMTVVVDGDEEGEQRYEDKVFVTAM